MDLSDIDLVTLLKATPDNAAFETLVRRHQAALRAFLHRLCGDASQADDLAQDTLMKAYARIETFEGGASFRSWLFSIAYREFLQARRKDDAGVRLTNAISSEISNDNISVDNTSADLSLDLRRALASLDDRERAAILMCDAVGLTQAEAAAALDAPLGTVKTYVARAREKMRAALRQPPPLAPVTPAEPKLNGACHVN